MLRVLEAKSVVVLSLKSLDLLIDCSLILTIDVHTGCSAKILGQFVLQIGLIGRFFTLCLIILVRFNIVIFGHLGKHATIGCHVLLQPKVLLSVAKSRLGLSCVRAGIRSRLKQSLHLIRGLLLLLLLLLLVLLSLVCSVGAILLQILLLLHELVLLT